MLSKYLIYRRTEVGTINTDYRKARLKLLPALAVPSQARLQHGHLVSESICSRQGLSAEQGDGSHQSPGCLENLLPRQKPSSSWFVGRVRFQRLYVPIPKA